MSQHIFRFGDFLYDFEEKQLVNRSTSQIIELSPLEEKLLYHFLINRGKDCTKAQLEYAVWPTNSDTVSLDETTLQKRVHFLREKIGKHHIKTLSGTGYRFVTTVEIAERVGIQGISQVAIEEPNDWRDRDTKNRKNLDLYAGVEGGGSEFKIAIGNKKKYEIPIQRIPTGNNPDTTLDKIITLLKPYQSRLRGIGVASFGPIGLNKKLNDYGHITDTPKDGWQDTPILSRFLQGLNVPVAFTTNSNAALLAEVRLGAGRDLSTVIYVCVGIGIGAGIWINGDFPRGIGHPEFGHVQVPLHDEDLRHIREGTFKIDPKKGCGHDLCLEKLAAGPSLPPRWEGLSGEHLTDHPLAWEVEAHYLAAGLVNLILSTMPQLIILGGGVMNHKGLLKAVRKNVAKQLKDYVRVPELQEKKGRKKYIVAPKLGDEAGAIGAMILAEERLKSLS